MTEWKSLILHNLYFVLGQAVQFVDERVNLAIRRLDLTLVQLAVSGGAAGSQALVQLQHPIDKRHHPVENLSRHRISLYRKHPTTWSFTRPTACIKA